MKTNKSSAILGFSVLGLVLSQISIAMAEDNSLATYESTETVANNFVCSSKSTKNIPEIFDCVFNAYSPLTEKASSPGNQINELLGFSHGRIDESFIFQDRASLFDSIEVRNLYRAVMRNQSEKEVYKTIDLPSPFDVNKNDKPSNKLETQTVISKTNNIIKTE